MTQEIQMSRNDLYSIEKQIIEIRKEKQALALLLYHSIQKFFTAANPELAISKSRFLAIAAKYIHKDENGILQTHAAEGKEEWKFLGSYKDDYGTYILGEDNVKNKFNDEVDKLMKQKITIKW